MKQIIMVDAPMLVDERIFTGKFEPPSKEENERFLKWIRGWHWTILPMAQPIYACRKGGWDTPKEFGPEFKTQKEAEDWLETNHPNGE